MRKIFFLGIVFLLISLQIYSSPTKVIAIGCDSFGGHCERNGCESLTEDIKSGYCTSPAVCCVPKGTTIVPTNPPSTSSEVACSPQNGCNCSTSGIINKKAGVPSTSLDPNVACLYPECYQIYFSGVAGHLVSVLRCYSKATETQTCCNTDTECPSGQICEPPPLGCPTVGRVVYSGRCIAGTRATGTTIEIHCKDKNGVIDPNLIDTALGCVPTDFNAFVVWFLQRAIGISGGIAFLLMILGGFRILTSAGDPKGVQAGGEMITSAITGLLFIIFSVFLLELIGVKILGIPGL